DTQGMWKYMQCPIPVLHKHAKTITSVVLQNDTKIKSNLDPAITKLVLLHQTVDAKYAPHVENIEVRSYRDFVILFNQCLSQLC
ncbi:hypothetical protein OFN94_38255, partial [Escherichia coli]|nr:hypothetical protein [Escherichia coli]